MSKTDVLRIYSRSKLRTKTNRHDIVALFLSSEISRYGLERGDRFPISEREIARALVVGRQSVNEAWHQLEADEVVELRHGVGVVVVEPERIQPDASSMQAYLQIREQAEKQLSLLVARNGAHDDLKAMEDVLINQQTAVKELQQEASAEADSSVLQAASIFKLFLADLEFHARLREAAGDPWLAIIEEIAEAKTQGMRLATFFSDQGYLSEFVQVHRDILEAVREQGESKVIEAVEGHFSFTRKWGATVLEKLAG